MRLHVLALALFAAAAPAASAAQGSVFRVTLPRDTVLAREPLSGRLIVFMTPTRPRAGARLAPGMDPQAVWIAAREVTGLAPGATVEIDADSLAFPRPFSAHAPGRRWVMALLDTDHNANWLPFTAGDLVSGVDSVDAVGTRAAPTPLTLSTRFPQPRAPAPEGVQVVELTSPLLSAFHGRPVVLKAAVIAPPESEAVATPGGPRYRAVYHIPGWGGSHRNAFVSGRRQVEAMRAGGERGAVHVFLEPAFIHGHPAFANSANNGPWADAFIRELIPHLEQRYGLLSESRARFLTGHSSGGWATLWLQVNHPDVFGGTWSTSPDPVDFADFTGIDMRPGSRDNFYRRADGSPRPFLKIEGRDVSDFESFVKMELVLGPGGQQQAFEAVFGPRGADGRPAHVFDRRTGALDPEVLRHWAAYDIRALLEGRWAELGPRLRGKLHVWMGGADNFYLTGSTRRLCDFLRGAGTDATCEIVPGRDHFDLQEPYDTYPNGLEHRFGQEMQAAFDRSR